MSDLLAIFGAPEGDAEVLGEISRLHPSRVTVLVEEAGTDWAYDDSPSGARLRERLAELLTAIEHETGASVSGLVGHRDQLVGWRFDREISGRTPIPA